MPRNPEITAALRAACIASCECEGQCYAVSTGASSGGGLCMVPSGSQAATAVAAFCECLAAAGAKHGLIETAHGSIYTGDLSRLAAAVEAAAHE